jgi:hypothetical protein
MTNVPNNNSPSPPPVVGSVRLNLRWGRRALLVIGYWVIGIYLELGIWLLEFEMLLKTESRGTHFE